jgi:integrase
MRTELIRLAASGENLHMWQRRLILDPTLHPCHRHGGKIGVPFGRTRHCPIRALDAWKTASAINEGPVFRPVDRHGKLAVGRLSGDAVSSIIRERVNAAGFDATGYSGHSLRAGLVTSAAQQGISSWKIRQQTGHASDAMMARYVRDGQLFHRQCGRGVAVIGQTGIREVSTK